MRDPLRIYVVFDPDFAEGIEVTSVLRSAFDAIGMLREGLRFSVPVHTRSVPWHPGELSASNLPKDIDFEAADSSAVLLIQDPIFSAKRTIWHGFVEKVKEEVGKREKCLFIPVLIGKSVKPEFAAETQSVRLDTVQQLSDEVQRTRFLVRLLNVLLVALDGRDQTAGRKGHMVFVSHAKHDGLSVAKRIVELLEKVNESLGPRCFFDADSLLAGSNYHGEFEGAIKDGSLLAVVTSAYHTRPWCRWEVLTAKRHGRPVVAVDLTTGRIERTFPYLGNVPSIRLSPPAGQEGQISEDDIALVTLALLSESLRVALWKQLAATYRRPGDKVCVRPPEMSDLGVLEALEPGAVVVYPDPPLSTEEVDLLSAAFPRVTVRSLSQLA